MHILLQILCICFCIFWCIFCNTVLDIFVYLPVHLSVYVCGYLCIFCQNCIFLPLVCKTNMQDDKMKISWGCPVDLLTRHWQIVVDRSPQPPLKGAACWFWTHNTTRCRLFLYQLDQRIHAIIWTICEKNAEVGQGTLSWIVWYTNSTVLF